MFGKKTMIKTSLVIVWYLIFLGTTTVFAFGKDHNGVEVTLQSIKGPVSLQNFRGKVVLIFFGYTSCPSVCPVSLATMESTFSNMERTLLNQTQALFITLDPEKDTLEKLTQYTEYFHPNILGVTGNPQAIAKVARTFGVSFVKKELKNSALGYVINHSADIYLINPDGQLQKSVPHDFPSQQLHQEIVTLLESKSKKQSQ